MSKQKSKQRNNLCAALKNKSRNTEIHQELKYFVDKATGTIGVFKCAFLCTASLGHASPPFSSSHSHVKAERATWG